MTLIHYYQSSTWRQTFRMLALGCLFSCFLISVRLILFRDWMYLFLVWNMFLAGLPLVFAFMLRYCQEHYKGMLPAKLLLAGLWLLFFPNAPYIITDLIHLHKESNVPLWYDASIVFSSALTGLAMGLISLYLIHQILKENLNRWLSWFITGLFVGLGSFGIYLGRVLRWNSWDIVTRPFQLLQSAYETLFIPSAMAMTFVFSCMLAFVYLMFYSLIEQKFEK
ncbi:MAG TPA: DUF1361 domain-containing protein [Cytophagales bacterium]|nr:DUF1361 domain-containing protein [Cytophagales bacterium]